MSYTQHPKNILSPVHRSFDDPYGKINDVQRKPRENSSLVKYPPKYTTAYIVL